MQIVIFKSPKFISALLRSVFKIKKSTVED